MTDFSFKPFQMDRSAACHYLRVGIKTFLKKYHNHPKLRHTRDGKAYMYLTSDLEAVAKLLFEEDADIPAPTLKPAATPIRLRDSTHEAFEQASAKVRSGR